MVMSLWGLLRLIVCVWRCVKGGQVCCCGFGGEIRSRCGFQCQELWWSVLGKSRMRLGVDDITVLRVVGMVLKKNYIRV